MIPVVRPRQRGFSMLEVLVALVLLSVALLSQARLQWMALANGKSADLKTTASLLANDLADRMRVNRAGFNAGSYALSAGADNSCVAVHFLDQHAAPVTCTSAQIAADDLADWTSRLAGLLPSGAGVACIDSTPDDGSAPGTAACDGLGGNYAIKVWWIDKAGASTSGATTSATPYRLAVAFRP